MSCLKHVAVKTNNTKIKHVTKSSKQFILKQVKSWCLPYLPQVNLTIGNNLLERKKSTQTKDRHDRYRRTERNICRTKKRQEQLQNKPFSE